MADGTPEQLKAEMGHDVVSVTLNGADAAATEAALAGLPGLQRAGCSGEGVTDKPYPTIT